jgi:hypothetical protein
MVTKLSSQAYVLGSTLVGGSSPTESSHIISGDDRVDYSQHNWPPGLYSGALYDRGGDYGSVHRNYSDDGRAVDIVLATPPPYGVCRGRIFPWVTNANPGSAHFPAIPSGSSQAELISWGTKAISNVLPTRPAADAATFVGELREGLPKRVGLETWRSRSLTARNAGSEYLNVEFGWKPLLSDARKFYEANKKADRTLANLQHGSGSLTRRRYDVEPATTSVTTEVLSTNAFPVPTGPTALYGVPGRRTKVTTTSQRKWFSGAFTYHVDIEQQRGFLRELDKLKFVYGANVTPELFWNLTPWSWLSDWKLNTGTVLHNLSAFSQDGLVLRWGYVMEESIISVTYALSGGKFSNGQPTDCRQTFTSIRRSRMKATPFGFGLNPASFTSRQWSILAALGATRAPNILR